MLIETPTETERLLLRPETAEDGPAIYRMNTDPDVMRFIGTGEPWTSPLEGFLDQHCRALREAAGKRYGSVSVELRASGEYIGWCSLTPEVRIGGVQLGYRFFKHAWGRGYATEAARVVVAIGFQALGLDRIYAATFPDNVASVRVLEKLGMTHVRDAFHERAGRPFRVYVLEKRRPVC